MLIFFRKKAAIISISIVTAMSASLLVGVLFLGGNSAPRIPDSQSNAIGYIGDIPITAEAYQENLLQYAQKYRINNSQKQDPEFIELLQYTAFEQTLQSSILANASTAAGLKVSNRDFENAIQGLLIQYDLKDIGQLKDTLKSNHYEWDAFETKLRNDILAQMYANYLQSSARVTQQDISNQKTSVRVRQILIRAIPGDKKSDEQAKVKAEKINSQLKSGESFEKLAKENSDDYQTKDTGGDLGWIAYGSTVPEFETVMYALDKGEISRPFKTPFGYHIIEVIDRKSSPNAGILTTDTARAELLKVKQSTAVGNYIRGVVSQSKLDIRNPAIKAYYSKSTGKYDDAIGAYQAMQSLNTYDPRPHYLIALIYLKQKKNDLALGELQRATLKGKLAPQADIPMAHVELGKLYGLLGKVASKNESFDTALDSAKGHLIMLKILQKQFKEIGDSRRESIAGTAALSLETSLRQATATANSSGRGSAPSSTFKI
ncbi:hypothetical protein EB093_02970 [bacterium]|nr:hypothetical protein [bacterium]